MTALFYTAIHEVQAVIVRKNWRVQQKNGSWTLPVDHVERLRVINRECPQIEPDFRSLKNWSEGARYRCQAFGSGHLQLAKGVLDRISAELSKIT